MSLIDWLEKHSACKEGSDWAVATGCETIQEVWLRDDLKPEWRIWIATRKGMVSRRVLRKFACACVRQVWHLLTDDRSRTAVEVAERYADGMATAEELDAAYEAAYEAACEAAAMTAACEATQEAAWVAARNASLHAARAVACGSSAKRKQNTILRQMVPTLDEAK